MKLGYFIVRCTSFLLVRLVSLLFPVNLGIEVRDKVFGKNIETFASKALKMGEKLVAVLARLVNEKQSSFLTAFKIFCEGLRENFATTSIGGMEQFFQVSVLNDCRVKLPSMTANQE